MGCIEDLCRYYFETVNTSNTGRLYPSEAAVTFGGKKGKAMADQLATVSKERLFGRTGVLSQEDMHRVEEAIKIQLDIR